MEAAELLYERVADRVAELIARGVLRPGDRAPSVRKLSRQENVSVATVVQAYQQLEVRGLVEARPQSGHYVRAPRPRTNIAEPRPPRSSNTATKPSVAHLVAKVYGAVRDPRIVNLGAAYPSPELLPTDRIQRIVASMAREVSGLAVSYDPPPGCPALRRHIARRAVDAGCAIPADELVTTVGAMEALHLALRAVAKPGDTVAIESPAYYGLLQLIESLGIRALEIPAQPGTGMDLDALEVALDTTNKVAAVMAIPSFANPLGSRMSNAGKKRLVSMLAAREIPLIEDDIYGDLPFPGSAPPGEEDRPKPAKAFDRDGLVILCSSFSKTIAPGYRVGWIAGGRYRDTIEALKFAHTVSTPTLPQLAIAEFIEGGGYDHHLRQLRRRFAAQVAQMREAISMHFPEGTRISSPTGGFVLWVELPRGSSIELHARALADGVSIAPGPIFSAKPRFSTYFRISCGLPWNDRIERAVETLGRIAHSLTPRP